MPRQGKSFLLLDRENANIIVDAIDIAAYDYIVLEVASSGTATGLLQFKFRNDFVFHIYIS